MALNQHKLPRDESQNGSMMLEQIRAELITPMRIAFWAERFGTDTRWKSTYTRVHAFYVNAELGTRAPRFVSTLGVL